MFLLLCASLLKQKSISKKQAIKNLGASQNVDNVNSSRFSNPLNFKKKLTGFNYCICESSGCPEQATCEYIITSISEAYQANGLLYIYKKGDYEIDFNKNFANLGFRLYASNSSFVIKNSHGLMIQKIDGVTSLGFTKEIVPDCDTLTALLTNIYSSNYDSHIAIRFFAQSQVTIEANGDYSLALGNNDNSKTIQLDVPINIDFKEMGKLKTMIVSTTTLQCTTEVSTYETEPSIVVDGSISNSDELGSLIEHKPDPTSTISSSSDSLSKGALIGIIVGSFAGVAVIGIVIVIVIKKKKSNPIYEA